MAPPVMITKEIFWPWRCVSSVFPSRLMVYSPARLVAPTKNARLEAFPRSPL
jgi:hypothetical protein